MGALIVVAGVCMPDTLTGSPRTSGTNRWSLRAIYTSSNFQAGIGKEIGSQPAVPHTSGSSPSESQLVFAGTASAQGLALCPGNAVCICEHSFCWVGWTVVGGRELYAEKGHSCWRQKLQLLKRKHGDLDRLLMCELGSLRLPSPSQGVKAGEQEAVWWFFQSPQ